MNRLILASTSLVRAKLLAAASIPFTGCASTVDEGAIRTRMEKSGCEPRAIALALAQEKALSVARQNTQDIVLGCDQLLAFDGKLFAKPQDMAQAKAQLKALRGKSHSLFTAAVLVRGSTILWQGCTESILTMRRFSDAFLADYLATAGEDILYCVGCYQLEGRGLQLFDGMTGDYFSVLGLPLLELMEPLRRYEVIGS